MSRLLGVLLTCLVLTGCTTASASKKDEQSHVKVDTPALRALKKQAGIATCLPGTARGALPKVTLPCLGGGPEVDLAGLRGPLVINLWAQWCHNCHGELRFYQELHLKGRGKVDVLGVDYQDTQPGAALTLARQRGVTYPLLADPDGVLQSRLGVRGLPGIVFVDRAGKVRSVQYRLISSYADLRALVRRQLGVDLPA